MLPEERRTDRQTDRQTDIAKLIFDLSNLANAPEVT